MNELSLFCLLIDDEREFRDRVTPIAPTQNGMIAAAEQVVSAARDAGTADAERVLQAVLELLKAASGESTKTA